MPSLADYLLFKDKSW